MIPMNTRGRSLSTLLTLVAICLSTAGDARETKDEKKPHPTRTEIDSAIARGVKSLLGDQGNDGSWGRDIGRTGLAVYALSHSGKTEKDAPVAKGVRWILTHLASPGTYEASLTVMALATVDREKYAKPIGRLAKLIQSGQVKNGQWSYKLKASRSGGDNSNTQFAILALWHARSAGAVLEPKVLRRTLEFFRDSQNEDGGWGYSDKERKKSYGSMTSAGLAALVIAGGGLAKKQLKDPALREDPHVKKAAAWLAKNFVPDKNPGARFRLGGRNAKRKEITETFWRYYRLWGLERAATLAGIEKMGERDWYKEGARFLLDSQRDDGSWVGSSNAVQTTCFALLFLRRATRRAVTTEPPVPAGTTTPSPKK